MAGRTSCDDWVGPPGPSLEQRLARLEAVGTVAIVEVATLKRQKER